MFCIFGNMSAVLVFYSYFQEKGDILRKDPLTILCKVICFGVSIPKRMSLWATVLALKEKMMVFGENFNNTSTK